MDFDTTQNVFIEAENMEALKILQKAYAGSVKMIYIDPPYNTGSDSFIYPDKFSETREEYARRVGDKDDAGYLKRDGVFQGAFRKNSRDNGHYHSNWLNMMLPRLHLAKTLLREDGVIFISIDDNEQAQLKLLCDEVFGAENFVTELIRKTKSTTNDAKTGLNLQHEICLVFAKNKDHINLLGGEKNLIGYGNPDDDPNGDWTSSDPSAKSGKMENNYFAVINPYTGKEDYPPTGRFWLFSKNTIQKHIDYGTICFKKEHKENERGFIFKRYKKDLKTNQKTLDSLVFCGNEFMNQAATKELLAMNLVEYFPYPKGVHFIKTLIEHGSENDDLILDFFSGSGTTAHAVMQLNAEDGGKRRYICVQLPEETEEKSEARKAGFATIAEIAKERIRRAGAQIRRVHLDAPNGTATNGATSRTLHGTTAGRVHLDAPIDTPNDSVCNRDGGATGDATGGATSRTLPDTGFKVFKLAESHFKQWRSPERRDAESLAAQLEMFQNVVAEDASAENMAYELALRLGFQLTDPMVFSDGIVWLDNAQGTRKTALLLECFDATLLDGVLAEQPQKIFALDRVFKGDDAAKTNAALQCQDAGVAFETL